MTENCFYSSSYHILPRGTWSVDPVSWASPVTKREPGSLLGKEHVFLICTKASTGPATVCANVQSMSKLFLEALHHWAVPYAVSVWAPGASAVLCIGLWHCAITFRENASWLNGMTVLYFSYKHNLNFSLSLSFLSSWEYKCIQYASSAI